MAALCIKCLDELLKQRLNYKKVYDEKLLDDTVRKLGWKRLEENMAVDGEMMMDRKTAEVLHPEVDYILWEF